GVTVTGVGAAVPGPVDELGGRAAPINLPALHGFPLRDRIADAAGAGLPIRFRRDGVAVVLAAQWLGGARGASSALGIVLSTGVGGGLIVGGRALGGNAGHIGQMQVAGMSGGDCLGSDTMLESVASGPNIVSWAREQGFAGITGTDLAAAYAAGDPVAVAAVARCAAATGQAIGSALALVPVDVVAIGGGFARVAPDLVDRIAAVVAAHPLGYVAAARVVDAGLDGDAPLVGAAALVYRAELLA
ncbi:ROK family protein, partial [Tsukamurella soli]